MDLSIPLVSTELAKRSFVPRVTTEWNNLSEEARSVRTRRGLRSMVLPKRSPPLYYGVEVDRQSSINLTRLRVSNSNLNLNLYRINLCESPICECGAENESTAHYLLRCTRYARARLDAIATTRPEMWNTNDLLHGSSIRYTPEENRDLCRVVQ